MIVDDDGVVVVPFMRTRYNYSMDNVSRETALACSDPTRTQQQFAEECNINTIVERFGITGQLPNNLRMPIQAEFVDTMDYQTSLNKLIEADNAFMELPADIRKQFGNDAGKFVDFVTDEKNVDQCRKWGLAMPERRAAEPMSVRVIADPAPDGQAT